MIGHTMSPAEALGRNVATWRRSFGWDQAALARRLRDLGFSARQNTISRIENATRPVPADELLALGFIFSDKANEDRPVDDITGPEPTGTAGALLRDPQTADEDIRAAMKRTLDATRHRLGQLQAEREELDVKIASTLSSVESLQSDWGL